MRIEELFLVFGVVFGALAGLIAFLRVYIEYSRHEFAGWRLWRESLVAGLFTFAVFVVVALALGFVLPRVV